MDGGINAKSYILILRPIGGFRLVREEVHNGGTIYVCDCGLGYDDILVAYACGEYYRTHGVNSEDITKKAIYNPRSERAAERIAQP
jgi:hypothetical protein